MCAQGSGVVTLAWPHSGLPIFRPGWCAALHPHPEGVRCRLEHAVQLRC